jgi:hypothetical protein
VHVAAEPIKQVRHAGVDVVGRDEVIVVQHHHDGAFEPRQRVDQDRQHLVVDRHARCTQAARHPNGQLRGGRLERRHHVAPEARRLVVGRVERHPREPRATGRGPLSQRARLAETGGRRHQGEARRAPRLERSDEIRTPDERIAHGRDLQLGPDHHQLVRRLHTARPSWVDRLHSTAVTRVILPD